LEEWGNHQVLVWRASAIEEARSRLPMKGGGPHCGFPSTFLSSLRPLGLKKFTHETGQKWPEKFSGPKKFFLFEVEGHRHARGEKHAVRVPAAGLQRFLAVGARLCRRRQCLRMGIPGMRKFLASVTTDLSLLEMSGMHVGTDMSCVIHALACHHAVDMVSKKYDKLAKAVGVFVTRVAMAGASVVCVFDNASNPPPVKLVTASRHDVRAQNMVQALRLLANFGPEVSSTMAFSSLFNNTRHCFARYHARLVQVGGSDEVCTG
jgi:hypothetical protein